MACVPLAMEGDTRQAGFHYQCDETVIQAVGIDGCADDASEDQIVILPDIA